MKFAKNYLAAVTARRPLPLASAQIFTYDQDFESLDINDGGALSGDGWLTYTNVFDAAGNFAYGYSSGRRPQRRLRLLGHRHRPRRRCPGLAVRQRLQRLRQR